jgi:acetyl-CoA carboxylase biotin carboxyl carrier protein
MEKEGFKITLKKGTDFQPIITTAAPVALPAPVAAPASTTEAAPAATPAAKEPSNLKEITSPMVGTFYSAASPDSPSYVTVGQEVTEDTVVCIIEAMKVFNEIPAEVSGKVLAVLVETGSAVEFGQPLFKLQK